MVNKRFILFNILIFLTFAVFAQSHFNQTLQWQADRNAYEYKVEVRGGGKTESYTTRQTSISVNLSAGDYEYRVIVYDFLGREASTSEWRKFNVLKAVAPDVSAPKKMEADVSGKNVEVPVEVKNIEKESTVELVNSATNQTVKGSLQTVSEGGKLVAASATFPKVSEGEWKVRVTNPSGLSSESGIIAIADKEKAEQVRKEEEARQLAEQKRLAEEQKKADLEKKKLEEQEKKLADEQKKADAAAEKARLEEEKKRLAEEEKARLEEEKRLAAEQKKIDEAERRRLEQEEKQRLAEEKQRLAQEELQRRQQEAERRAAEAEERARLAEERRQAEALARQQRADAKKKAQERQKEMAEKAKLAEERHKELVKIQEEEDRKRAEEEKKLAEARKAEEERLAKEEAEREKERQRLAKKEARRNTPKLELNIMAGAGNLFNIYENQLFSYANAEGSKLVPEVKAAVSFLPIKGKGWRAGVEVNAQVAYLQQQTEYADYQLPLLLTNVNFDFQKALIEKKLYLGLKAGGGISLVSPMVTYDAAYNQRNEAAENKIYGYLNAQGGVSLFWIPVRSLAVEIGADYTHLFIQQMQTGIVSPYVVVGIRL